MGRCLMHPQRDHQYCQAFHVSPEPSLMFLMHHPVPFISTLTLPLQTHVDACKELRESPTFMVLLAVTRDVGNYINRGSKHGGAQGFRLKTLLTMHEKHSPDKTKTLLQVGEGAGSREGSAGVYGSIVSARGYNSTRPVQRQAAVLYGGA